MSRPAVSGPVTGDKNAEGAGEVGGMNGTGGRVSRTLRGMATAHASPTPNPDALKFTLDVALPSMINAASPEEAQDAFTRAVFASPGVANVFGVNDFVTEGDEPIGILYIDESAAGRQLAKLNDVRKTRDNGRVRATLDALKDGARGSANTMPLLIDAVRAYATVGEMCDALREVWGEYAETPII